MGAGVSWFPPELAYGFFILKGLVALTGTLMLIAHMQHEWSESLSRGRRGRYYALLAYAVVQTIASTEQVAQDAIVEYRNLLALLPPVVLVAAMWYSIKESRR